MKLTTVIKQFWQRNHPTTNEYWYAYVFLIVVRVVLVFVPQLGYVHPDEFFQTLEIINGDHFHLEHVRTWEFNNTMPIRGITLQFILLRMPWTFLEVASVYIKHYFNIEILCSYTLLVLPRFVYCGLSFINDWVMYKLCQLYGLQPEIRLFALSSSWVTLVFATRTFSNTLEMMFCSLLLYYVAECMIITNTVVYKKEFLEQKYNEATSIGERVKIWKLKNALPAHNFRRFFTTATLCVAGIFNRPTFFLFGAPMIFYWLFRGLGTKTVTYVHFHLRMLLFCLSTLPAVTFFVLFDSLYYRYLTASDIQTLNIGLENFVCTPWNFIKYNMNPHKTAQHGIHPKYLHVLVNIPLLFGILGIIAVVAFAQFVMKFIRAEYRTLPRTQSIVGLMTASIFVPLFSLSLCNHQEARFLIPLIFPIILLHAPKLRTGFCQEYPFQREHSLLRWLHNNILSTKASSTFILQCWYIMNIVLTIFFGFIHQAGVYPLAQHFEQIIQYKPNDRHIHLITSHIYSVPLSLINIPSSNVWHFNRKSAQRYKRLKDFYLYEYGSLDITLLLENIKKIAIHCKFKENSKLIPYRLYLALPASLSLELYYSVIQTNDTFLNYNLRLVFYPHLSTEAFPNIFNRHSCLVDSLSVLGDGSKDDSYCIKDSISDFNFSNFVYQFGLALYEVTVKQENSTILAKLPDETKYT